MNNRRLVPMPSPKRRRPSSEPAATQPPRAPLKTWHAFAFLIVTAVVMYYAKWPILIIAAIVGIIQVWALLARRYPKTMWFLLGVFRGLMRR